MFPSVKTLVNRLGVSQYQAETIRKLMMGAIPWNQDQFPGALHWYDSCYNKPDDDDCYGIMLAISDIIGGYGVEHLESSKWIDNYYHNNCCEYINMGDAYDTTVLYDTERDSYYVMSYGDYVETYERSKRGTIR